MDLHTSGKEPDWANVPPEEMNQWQRRAEKTNGWDTPGNEFSLAGAIITVGGIVQVAEGNPILGVFMIATGRSFDIADGIIADETGTKSPKGELVDASLDKAQIAAALAILWANDIISDPVAFSFFTINVANVVFSAIAKKKQNEIHPSASGKLSTVAQWGTVGSAGLAYHFNLADMETATSIAEYTTATLATIATGLGVSATAGYFKDAWPRKPK